MSKNKENKEQALMKIESQYPIFGDSASRVTAIVQRNLGGDLSPNDLDRISIPKGDAKFFTIPTIDGDITVEKFNCIILYKKKFQNNAYWAKPYEANNTDPPDCYSDDGISGIGTPGGSCKTCKNNQFGSNPQTGKGKACQNRQFIFPLLPDDYIPYATSLPPTSLPAMKKYGIGLGRRNLFYTDVVTEVSLETTKGYARAVFKVAKDDNGKPMLLNEEERKKIEALVFGPNGMQHAFEAVNIDQADVSGGGIE